jgi:hypothetical protein
VPLPASRPATLLAAAEPAPSAGDAAAAAKRRLAAGLLALAAHIPARRDRQDDPVSTGSISAFADSAGGLDAVLRSGRLATAALPAPSLPAWRRTRVPTPVTRRIADAFTDPIAALIEQTDAAASPLVSRPLDDAGLRTALSPERLARDADGGLVHPEQIHIAGLLAVPARVAAAGFSTAPVRFGPDHFAGAAVALVPTRAFAISADAAHATDPRG